MINIANTRNIGPSKIFFKDNSNYRIVRIVTFKDNELLTIWEEMLGFIFTKDNYSLATKDNFVVKCKDQ